MPTLWVKDIKPIMYLQWELPFLCLIPLDLVLNLFFGCNWYKQIHREGTILVPHKVAHRKSKINSARQFLF